jgi:cytidylate kinase
MPRSSLESLIESNVRLWERNRLSRLSREKNTEQPEPIIAISRQIGSGGAVIAELTAKKLKFQFLDRQIVEAIATQANIRKSAVESIDEKGIGFVEEFLSSTFMPQNLSHKAYMRHLVAVLIVAARHGSAVVLGRGSQFLLPAFPLFRVRILCPFEKRVERIAKRDHLSSKEAKEKVRASDDERTYYIKSHFNVKIDDALNYDLMVNTEDLTAQQASEIIVLSYRVRHSK